MASIPWAKCFAVLTLAGSLQAQTKAPSPTPAPGGGLPTPTAPTRGTSPIPNTNPTQTQIPEMPRPIFIAGKVLLNDGTPPPESVTIESVCNSRIRPEGYTDSKGRFQIELGNNRTMLPDASQSSDGDFGGGSQGLGNLGGGTRSSPGISSGQNRFFGCELRAVLPGFRSDTINLSMRRSMDSPDVGTIILHRIANVEGLTISATSLNAPKDAKKAFDKGLEAKKKNKLDEAQKQFEKAVEAYPKYAVAWYELGALQEIQSHPVEARKSYDEALKADSKLITPYERLAAMAVRDKKWDDAVTITDRMIRLNPIDFPSAYFYSAIANLNLQKLEPAEKSAEELLKLDKNHRIAKAEHVMAVILAQKEDWTGAAAHFKAFIQYSAPGAEVELAKKQLAEVEKTIEAKKQ